MREFIIGKNEANQRLDKFLAKVLDKAPKSFLYKMLRKKNIVLNDKKALGDERIEMGNSVKLWLSEETIANFQSEVKVMDSDAFTRISDKKQDEQELQGFAEGIVYEDEDCILYNKPSGWLSQKSKASDISLNEMLIRYLEEKNQTGFTKVFMPSVCNRLDRNTSGLVIFGKSLRGLQEWNAVVKNRSIKKEYLCVVAGKMQVGERFFVKGYLYKDEKTNRVRIMNELPSEGNDVEQDGNRMAIHDSRVKGKNSSIMKPIETEYEVLKSRSDLSLLRVHLITGRSHQIRAHLASMHHPILGDAKYGDVRQNQKFQKYGIHSQVLHAYRLTMPKDFALENMAGRCFVANVPKVFKKLGFEV